MQKRWILSVLAASGLCLVGCDPASDGETGAQDPPSAETETEPSDTEPGDETDGMTSVTPEETTGDPEETTGDTEEPPPEDDDECSFLDCDTGPTPVGDCSLWDQDCMEGEKCNPWANDGGSSWNSSTCTPLDAAPGQPGEACTVEGSGLSGVDTCDVASMCWNVDEEGGGTCVALCEGTQEAAVCANPATSCIIANEGFLPLCLPTCDPLLQDCADGEACYPGDNGFVCAPDASGPEMGGFGDACEFTNACDPSLLCVGAAAFPDCGSTRCCTDFCDLDDPESGGSCGGVAGGQECVAFFAEGAAPPGMEGVGFCAIPE